MSASDLTCYHHIDLISVQTKRPRRATTLRAWLESDGRTVPAEGGRFVAQQQRGAAAGIRVEPVSSETNQQTASHAELGPRFQPAQRPVSATLPGMPCEMHSVTPAIPQSSAAAAATGAARHVTGSHVTAGSCSCLHRKRTLDTLRQRLARRLKRARRHRRDVTDDDERADDDVSDDVSDTPAGEPTILVNNARRHGSAVVVLLRFKLIIISILPHCFILSFRA